MLIEFAGMGHNDAVMIAFMLLSYRFYQRGRTWAMAACAILAPLAKLYALLISPLVLIGFIREGCDRRQRARRWIGVAVLAISLSFCAYLPFWAGLRTLAPVLEGQEPINSLVSVVVSALRDIGGATNEALTIWGPVVAASTITAVAMAWWLRR